MQRRELRYSNLEAVKADLIILHTNGYTKTGKWELSQIANHLADWVLFPMDGFPKSPLFVSMLIGIMRVTQGKSLYRKFVQDQRMATGQPTIPRTVHKDKDQAESVERLAKTLDRFAAHRGPIHPSPLFGELNYDELMSLQLAHCAHHMSFLVPN